MNLFLCRSAFELFLNISGNGMTLARFESESNVESFFSVYYMNRAASAEAKF